MATQNTTQTEELCWTTIEQDFNHATYTAEAISGLLYFIANSISPKSQIAKIDANTMQSATYAMQTSVSDMDKKFQQLLKLHIGTTKSNKLRKIGQPINWLKEMNAETTE